MVWLHQLARSRWPGGTSIGTMASRALLYPHSRVCTSSVPDKDTTYAPPLTMAGAREATAQVDERNAVGNCPL